MIMTETIKREKGSRQLVNWRNLHKYPVHCIRRSFHNYAVRNGASQLIYSNNSRYEISCKAIWTNDSQRSLQTHITEPLSMRYTRQVLLIVLSSILSSLQLNTLSETF